MLSAIWHAMTGAILSYAATFVVGFVARHYGPRLLAFARSKLGV